MRKQSLFIESQTLVAGRGFPLSKPLSASLLIMALAHELDQIPPLLHEPSLVQHHLLWNIKARAQASLPTTRHPWQTALSGHYVFCCPGMQSQNRTQCSPSGRHCQSFILRVKTLCFPWVEIAEPELLGLALCGPFPLLFPITASVLQLPPAACHSPGDLPFLTLGAFVRAGAQPGTPAVQTAPGPCSPTSHSNKVASGHVPTQPKTLPGGPWTWAVTM